MEITKHEYYSLKFNNWFYMVGLCSIAGLFLAFPLHMAIGNSVSFALFMGIVFLLLIVSPLLGITSLALFGYCKLTTGFKSETTRFIWAGILLLLYLVLAYVSTTINYPS